MSCCAIFVRGDVCMPRHVLLDLLRQAQIAPPASPAEDEAKRDELLRHYKVDFEHELWRLTPIKNAVPEARAILELHYKPVGSHGPQPLSNFELDHTLWQWEKKWPDFCNLGFAMINFATYDGTPMQALSRLADLMAGRGATWVQHELGDMEHKTEPGPHKRRFAFILNSDEISGNGKHWTCVFWSVDGSRGVIEFFNSSGNAPYPEINKWWPKLERALMAAGAAEVSFVPVTAIQHQHGNTECGVYCLYYIWSRLNGRSAESFKHGEIPDDKMTAFRKQLFREK